MLHNMGADPAGLLHPQPSHPAPAETLHPVPTRPRYPGARNHSPPLPPRLALPPLACPPTCLHVPTATARPQHTLRPRAERRRRKPLLLQPRSPAACRPLLRGASLLPGTAAQPTQGASIRCSPHCGAAPRGIRLARCLSLLGCHLGMRHSSTPLVVAACHRGARGWGSNVNVALR